MKVLQVISSVNPSGGGPIEGVRQLGASLSAAGHRVEIASLDAPHAPYLDHGALPVHALGPARSGYGFSGRFIPWLRANRSKYDAVIVNGIWQFHSFGAWRALRKSTTPYVLFTHGMLDPWFKRRYPLKHLKKWMYWPWADYRVLRDAQAVLFTCEEERRLARTSFWLYRCNEAIVSLGIAKPTGDPKKELREFISRFPEAHGKRIVLFLGRVHPKKGCDLLIDAFARVLRDDPDWHLVMAGPDQIGWRKALTIRAERMGMASRITWTGMIDGAVKWGALRAAEVFMLPSHQENFGLAVAESLAAGVPPLISNKVNIWREVDDDGAGLVSDDTLESTCGLLKTYSRMTPERQQAMRLAAARCFEQRFEIEKATQTLQSVLGFTAVLN